jgi:hypothetical protein
MADQDIVQNMITRLGQSQRDRLTPELDVHFADVDERTSAELLAFLRDFAENIRLYAGTDPALAVGDWRAFLPVVPPNPADAAAFVARLQTDDSGTQPPHLALALAFLELYRVPQATINTITARHLDFFYRRVLRFAHRGAVADRANVIVDLKPGSKPTAVLPMHEFSGGKDASGIELIYRPTAKTVINTAKVESLCSVFVDEADKDVVGFAPIAKSSDGLGGELTGDEPRWRAFGHPQLPHASIGFAVSSPVLRMREGARAVTVALELGGSATAQAIAPLLATAVDAYVTGEKGWLGPFVIRSAIAPSATALTLQVDVPATEKGVVDFDPAIHGGAFGTASPVLQLLLKPDQTAVRYHQLAAFTVRRVRISVEVKDVTSLNLESDAGTLDPSKAFQPFGAQPVVGSRFMVGYAEAFSKRLEWLSVTVDWQNADRLAERYTSYADPPVRASDFTAHTAFSDAVHTTFGDVSLFGQTNGEFRFPSAEAAVASASAPTSAPPATPTENVSGLRLAGSSWSKYSALRQVRMRPILGFARVPAPRQGFLTFTLTHDFLHKDYRSLSVVHALNFGRGIGGGLVVLQEPYTPTIQNIRLSYAAQSDDANVEAPSEPDFASANVQFFHVGCFGQMREHGFQRQQFQSFASPLVPLVPPYEFEGELLIGLRHLRAGDSASVLFQVAEGSAAPDLPRQPVEWSVLCDNYWKPLDARHLVRDRTNDLLRSGIIEFVIPREATTENTIMPGGMVWLRAAVRHNVTAVSELIDVIANAVEVQFDDRANDSAHLGAALAAQSIAKVMDGPAAVKSVKQPYASFGGRERESDGALRVRAAERLRHRRRCITAWDYERLILGAFPEVHQVKCIPHARDGAWLSPGHVLIVVVPDLRNKNARDPLQPKVDADTLSRIEKLVVQRSGMYAVRDAEGVQTSVRIANPRYQQIRLQFAVKLRDGLSYNYYSEDLNTALVRFLSPWAFGASRSLSFGGTVYRSTLLDFVERMPYVDYVKDFRMFSFANESNELDRDHVAPDTPDAVLVSAARHDIREIP